MSTFYTTFLSKSDLSFALFLVTFEPLEIQQSNIPLLKALKCGNNAVGAQRCSCLFTFCHAPLKIALLLHKMANECKQPLVAVHHSVPFTTYNKLSQSVDFAICGTILLGPKISKLWGFTI